MSKFYGKGVWKYETHRNNLFVWKFGEIGPPICEWFLDSKLTMFKINIWSSSQSTVTFKRINSINFNQFSLIAHNQTRSTTSQSQKMFKYQFYSLANTRKSFVQILLTHPNSTVDIFKNYKNKEHEIWDY